MSKKSKKREPRVNNPAKSETPASNLSMSVMPTKTPMLREKFNPDYRPVIIDLKRIGSLAGFFLIVLIVLTFFLR